MISVRFAVWLAHDRVRTSVFMGTCVVLAVLLAPLTGLWRAVAAFWKSGVNEWDACRYEWRNRHRTAAEILQREGRKS